MKIMEIPSTKKKNLSLMENEMKAYQELYSRHILSCIAQAKVVAENKVTYYQILELMKKNSIDYYCKNDKLGIFTLRQKFKWSRQIIKGLRRIHSKGFMHLDIKPDNILISDSYAAKISDMGTVVVEAEVTSDLIFPQSVAAPELRATKRGTRKSDIFSYGLMVNLIFTGKKQTLLNDTVSFQEETEYFWEVVKACILKEPKSRPTAEEIEAALDEFNTFFKETYSNDKNGKYKNMTIEEKNKYFIDLYEKFCLKDDAKIYTL